MSHDEGPPVELVFLWHHHQPDYRSPREGRSLMPWVRLHATKDYLDMALRLERHPAVRAAFNFVPSLLDQIEHAAAGGGDVFFELAARAPAELSAEERADLARRCAMAPPWALERWPRYAQLVARAGRAARRGPGAPPGPTDAELVALVTWFLLAWLDPMLHGEPEAAAAIARGGDFTVAQRDGLLALHRRLLGEVLPAYRRLAERGQIELVESPYYHPIVPLLVDPESARRAQPDVRLPGEPLRAPEDARLQIERGLERHARAFGARPRGMWPPEGAVSPEAAALYAAAGVRWIATDEGVLWHSLPPGARRREMLYRPWRIETPAGDLALFFRDRELSDRIGFVYHHWSAEEAVADFLGRVRRVAREHPHEGVPVVCVILDGENCWEHYADDGGPFLDALYAALAGAGDIRTRTPSEVLERHPAPPALSVLHSGSWIDADFHIWIGHPEKNRAWDLLSRTRRALVEEGPPKMHPRAWEHLLAAEGSDWFWWYGDDHFTTEKSLFDRIFREHLQAVHEALGRPVPGWLQVPVLQFGREPGLAVRPIGLVRPVIDGRRTQFYEWHAAGRHRLGVAGGSMHRGPSLGKDLYFGFDLERFYLRLDFATPAPPGARFALALEMLAPRPLRLRVDGLEPGAREVREDAGAAAGRPVDGAACVIGSVLELGVPFASLGLEPGTSVEMLVQLLEDGDPYENLPGTDLLRFTVPDPGFEASMWSA
uniref:Glycoside hydrolase n=1 Tax=Eiseniibacteriota bacterium TaxID=2212470 RepID=A0A832HZV8_UNCEI